MATFLTTSLLKLRAVLVPALDEMMASDLERRPYIIVRDVVTKRYVQFARRYKPKTGELLFDVPALHIVLRSCPDTNTAATWAIAALMEQGLPDDAELVLKIDGEEAN